MDTLNPYAAPQATVADVATAPGDGPGALNFWTWRGRIGRLRFLAWTTGAWILLRFATVLAAVVMGAADLGLWVLAVPSLAVLVLTAFWTVQRSHDMGWSGWTALLCIIPLVGLIWVFKGGDAGRNEFGAPPPPNNWGVRILGLLLPVTFAIGMLAAVALPAYQDYVTRSTAAGTTGGN